MVTAAFRRYFFASTKTGRSPRGCLGADAAQVMPRREVLHGLTNFLRQSIELRVYPLLEAWEVRVALGEQAVVLKQGPQMLGGLAGDSVESLVGYCDGSVAQVTKERLDLGRALPDDGRFRPIRCTERVDESNQCRVGRCAVQQLVEVVAKGAQRAHSRPRRWPASTSQRSQWKS